MSEIKLRVLGSYDSAMRHYQKGDSVTTDRETAEFLMRDSPGTFEVMQAETEIKMVDGPPKDKMMRSEDYESKSFGDLREELKSRGLPSGGPRSELEKRLKRADANE